MVLNECLNTTKNSLLLLIEAVYKQLMVQRSIKDCIKNKNRQLLEEELESYNEINKQINVLEQERERNFAQLIQLAGLPLSSLSWNDLYRLIPNSETVEEINHLVIDLREKLFQMKSENEALAFYVNGKVELVNGFLNALKSEEDSGTYSREGGYQGLNQSNSLFIDSEI